MLSHRSRRRPVHRHRAVAGLPHPGWRAPAWWPPARSTSSSTTRRPFTRRSAPSCSAPWPMRRLFVPSACGGGGTCGQCRVKVLEGGGVILPTETAHINKREARGRAAFLPGGGQAGHAASRCRARSSASRSGSAACAPTTTWPPSSRSWCWSCPRARTLDFRAGGYIQIECPPHELDYAISRFEDEFRDDWDRFDLWQLHSRRRGAGDARLLHGQLPGREGHHHAQRAHRHAAARACPDVPPGRCRPTSSA